MKKLLLVFFVFLGLQLSAQSIYKGLKYEMSKKEAKQEFKDHKDLYKNIDLGNGFVYSTKRDYFEFEDKKLGWIILVPKNHFVSHKNAVAYCNYTKKFMLKKGYQVFFQPEYWNAPLNFNSSYGLLMFNKSKTKMLQLYSFPTNYLGRTVYVVNLEIRQYDSFMKKYKYGKKLQKEKSKQSGF